jgi:hypothetical protein
MLSANVLEKPGTSVSKADNEGLFIRSYKGEGVSGRSILVQDTTEIFRVVAMYNLEYHQPYEYVPLINCYEVYEITSDVEIESLNDVRSMRFEDITMVTRKIILHWYVTSVVCPKYGGRISPRNVGTFYQPASVTWQKMVINIRINESISSSFIEVNQAFRLIQCLLRYSYLASLSLRRSIVFADP